MAKHTGTEEDETDKQLAQHTNANLNITCSRSFPVFCCDMGYGLPKETRPRKEKLLAIARQLIHFLVFQWSQDGSEQSGLVVVACNDRDALLKRMEDLWKQEKGGLPFPSNFAITDESLEDWLQQQTAKNMKVDGTVSKEVGVSFTNQDEKRAETAPTISTASCYLSPDADTLLPTENSSSYAVYVIGLLIDRRTIQVNRSKDRAEKLSIPAARLPLDTVVLGNENETLDPHEPLNVDCILELLQQWHWNGGSDSGYQQALLQALQNHSERHPGRPIHKK